MFIKHPRFLSVKVNSDEQLGVYVKAIAIISDDDLLVSGAIEREDSRIIRRAHKPTVVSEELSGLSPTFFLRSYHEFDDNDGGQIHVEFTLSRIPYA